MGTRFPRREDVDRSNVIRMQSLEGEQYQYKSCDGGTIQDPQQRAKLLSNFMAADCLSLRVGAQVMLIKNVDENLVNGSMGRIVAFCDPASYSGIMDEDLGKVGAKGTVGHAAKVGPGEKYPEVEFTIGKTSIKRLMVPETWKTELPDGTVQVSRTQVNHTVCISVFFWLMALYSCRSSCLGPCRSTNRRVKR
jgi:ATP-dependent DNA helicase PIF1